MNSEPRPVSETQPLFQQEVYDFGLTNVRIENTLKQVEQAKEENRHRKLRIDNLVAEIEMRNKLDAEKPVEVPQVVTSDGGVSGDPGEVKHETSNEVSP